MARCELTGKGPVASNLVSHSNIKTKTRSFANVQYKQVFSNALNTSIQMKLAASTIRSLDHCGGFDKFILNQPNEVLSKKALTFKQRIQRKISKPSAKTSKKAVS